TVAKTLTKSIKCYGGGFYDRTLEQLRTKRPTMAIGFAYSVQEARALPLEPTDQPLDLIVTEAAVITPEKR
ncbi:MAG: 5-formyltetrahydrofolate cyclo-ligase, partial [Pseudomonadota bacterium]